MCHFHMSNGHNTSDCLQLKDILEKLVDKENLLGLSVETSIRSSHRDMMGQNGSFKRSFRESLIKEEKICMAIN
jgi:hypothetical protein